MSRCTSAGGHGPSDSARSVKKAAKSATKNISSDEMNTIVPTVMYDGRSMALSSVSREGAADVVATPPMYPQPLGRRSAGAPGRCATCRVVPRPVGRGGG